MADSSDEITKGYVKEDVLERIVRGETTAKDVIALKDSFASNQKEKDEFVKELGKNLTPDALHKLNSMVMQQADILAEKTDPQRTDVNFQCRTTHEKIFQQLLQLEAEQTGMKAEFAKEGNFIPPKLSAAIEDHYATLSQKDGFYDKRAEFAKDSKESRMAQSIGFMLDAPLTRNTDYYANLSPQAQYSFEAEVKGIRLNKLNDNKSPPPQHKTYEEMGIKETKLDDKEVQEKVSKIGKAFSKPLANNIIDATLKNLESENFSIDDEHKNKITSALSEALQNIPYSKLSNNKEEIINNITKDLKQQQTAFSKATHILPGKSSYHISTENVKKIANGLTQKYPEDKKPETAIIAFSS